MENSARTVENKTKIVSSSGFTASLRTLHDYVRLVGQISDHKKNGMEIGQAAQEAVDWAIKENFLEGIKEGIGIGAQQKAVENAVTLVRKYNASPESAAADMDAPLDKVLEALAAAPVQSN